MTPEEHEKELAKQVKDKIAELSYAHYQGDIRAMAIICMNKNGDVQIMQCFDSLAAPHIYVAADMLKDQIRGMLRKNARVSENSVRFANKWLDGSLHEAVWDLEPGTLERASDGSGWFAYRR